MSGTEVLIGLSIAGTTMSAIGAIQQGQAASAAAKYNAQMAERNAQIARQQAAADEERQRRAAYLRQGALRAGYGAAGVDLEGSPLDILEASAEQEELDALTIRYKGEIGATGYEAQAALDRAQSRSLATQGYLKAGSEILMGGARTVYFGMGGGSRLDRAAASLAEI